MKSARRARPLLAIGTVAALLVTGTARAEVDWSFAGELNAFPGATLLFDRVGHEGDTPSPQQLHGMVAQYFHNASADTGTHELKSGSLLNYQLSNGIDYSWQRASSMGQAAAWYRDQLTVNGLLGNGYIEFEWDLQGTLSAQAQGDPGYFTAAYEVAVDFFVLNHSSPGVSRIGVYDDSILRGTASGPPLFEPPVPDPIDWLDPAAIGSSKSIDYGTLNKRIWIPFQENTAADVSFHLFTGVSLVAQASDVGSLVLQGSSSFENTAVLRALKVLDEDGRPVTAPFTLVSANGLVYPVSSVPEPATWALWLAGLVLLVRRAGRPANA